MNTTEIKGSGQEDTSGWITLESTFFMTLTLVQFAYLSYYLYGFDTQDGEESIVEGETF